MSYLFVAFSIVWLGIFLYNFYLVRRVERLERELKALGEFITGHEKGQK